MDIQNKHFHGLAAFAVFFLFSTSLSAGPEKPLWAGDLEAQLLLDEDCRVIEYETIHNGKLGEKAIYFATVVCEDGRRLDVTRMEPDEDFTVRTCKIVRC